MDTFLPLAEKYGYLAIFATLMASGLGFPLPEDIPLLTGGWLCSRGALSVAPTIAVGLFGVLLGDSIIFLAGRRVGGAMDEHPWFKRHFGGPRKAKVERYFARYGDRTVFIGRFAAGVRAWIFFSAGVSGMTYTRFFLYDGAAALASVPALVVLAWTFGEHIDQIFNTLVTIKRTVFVVALVVVPGLLAWWWVRRRREMALAVSEPAKEAAPSEEPAAPPGPAPR